MPNIDPDHPIHDLIADRWSPYAFAESEVSDADLRSLFEAARWAPSSYNEQPWRFLVAKRSDRAAFERALACLVDANQAWAKHAAVLVLTVTSKKFAKNGNPNAAAQHDLGLAAANLSLEATARGLHVHQMIGVHHDKVRETYAVPADYEPLTAIAIGRAATNGAPAEDMRARDVDRRGRNKLAEFVFADRFGQTAKWAEGGKK